MSVVARVGGFAVALAVLFAGASLAGAKLDPGVDEGGASHETEPEPIADAHGTATGDTEAAPGLAVSEDGYRLVADRTVFDPERRARLSFRVVDEDGATVRDFDVEHERRMHLIVVRRDFEGFQHLHPRQLADGRWVAAADLAEPGVYRAFADFATGGEPLTLAADLFVAGRFDPSPLPAPATSADAGDGYEVAIDSPAPRSGGVTDVAFTVSRDGRPVDSIQPYLGADGHLVALREHDQAFLHTHPEGDPGGPGPISFGVEYPTRGRYRLFLQFRHGGEVRTAAFTQSVAAPGGAASGDAKEGGNGHD